MPKGSKFHVLQIAKNELSRKKMEGKNIEYNYNYTLLFDDYIENIPKLKEIWKVLTFIIKYQPDVLNVSGYSSSASTIPAIVLGKLMGIKIVMSNESTKQDNSRSGLKETIKRWAVKASSGFVVFGKSSEDYLVELGAKREKVIVKKGAVVDNERILNIFEKNKGSKPFSNIKTEKNFIFVGRISSEKNVRLLVQAFQELNLADWGLIIVGNGSDDLSVLTQIKEKPENIYKFDGVGWTEIPKFFTQADCLVLPSKSEPWGLVVNEAMVCGLSVIVSDACGCVEDLVHNNGFTIIPNNLNSLKAAMNNISTHANLEEMKENSKEIIKSFAVDSVAMEYVKNIEKL